MNSDEHKKLVAVVKGVHDHLRKACSKYNGSYDEVWQSHLAEVELRKKYSEAMSKLATDIWSDSRIQWCVKTILDFFHNGGMERSLLREVKCSQREGTEFHMDIDNMLNLISSKLKDGEKMRLLDVGSCYNPFASFEEFQVIALDLTPATEDVFSCDFLQLKVLPGPLPSKNLPLQHLEQLPPESFHAVVFSLVLEYLPAAEQRLTFCYKAWQLLQNTGILLIITPDSKSVNHNAPMMKSWKNALEKLGFTRYSYEKHTHFHCMAYRKNVNKACVSITDKFSEMAKLMYIPQDFKDFKDEPVPIDRTNNENEEVQRIFSELPLYEDIVCW